MILGTPTARTITDTARVFTLGLLLTAALTGCGSSRTEAVTKVNNGAPTLEMREVAVAPVSRRNFERRIRLTGSLEPRERVQLRALVEGPLDTVAVEIGDEVTKDAVLAKTRPIDAQLELQIAETAYEVAKADWIALKAWRRDEELAIQRAKVREAAAEFERLKQDELRIAELHESGNASKSDLDELRADVQMAAAKLEIARQELAVSETGPSLAHSNLVEAKMSQADAVVQQAAQVLRDTELRAPFNGVVTTKAKQSGDFAKRGDVVVEVMNTSVLEANFNVPERFSADIVPGSEVDLQIDSVGIRRVGKVAAVNQAIEPATRTFLIKVQMENVENEIKAGIFCVGYLSLPTVRDALAIPLSAVEQQEGRTVVWTIDEGVVDRRFVITGERDDNFVQILDGLDEDSRVVIQGGGALVPGDVVTVTDSQRSTDDGQ